MTHMMPDKDKEPGAYKMKWKCGDIIKAASANVRGMGDPIKREEIITQMEKNGIDIMCLQETKIPDSCYEVRKGYALAFFSTSTD